MGITWILVIILMSPNGNALSTMYVPHLDTEKTCRHAQYVVKRDLQGSGIRAAVSCIPSHSDQ